MTVADVTKCNSCGADVTGLTTLHDMTADGTFLPRCVGCDPVAPKCPVHKVLMDGGGINWTCPMDGCTVLIPDSGDQL